MKHCVRSLGVDLVNSGFVQVQNDTFSKEQQSIWYHIKRSLWFDSMWICILKVLVSVPCFLKVMQQRLFNQLIFAPFVLCRRSCVFFFSLLAPPTRSPLFPPWCGSAPKSPARLKKYEILNHSPCLARDLLRKRGCLSTARKEKLDLMIRGSRAAGRRMLSSVRKPCRIRAAFPVLSFRRVLCELPSIPQTHQVSHCVFRCVCLHIDYYSRVQQHRNKKPFLWP